MGDDFSDYYAGADLRNLEKVLNKHLGEFGDLRGLELGFEFTKLGREYKSGCSPESTRLAIGNRCPVWVN